MTNPKNINKDYVVTVNAKNSTLIASNSLTFYITDINTSNIFFQLQFDEVKNSLINTYKPESADEYHMTLRIIKPNGAPVEIKIEPLDQMINFYYVDLPNEYKDHIGTYICEIFIDTEIADKDGTLRLERSTTNSFTYEVIPSIYNSLDDEVEEDPSYPLIDTVINRFDSLVNEAINRYESYDYATRDYVDTSIEQFVETLIVNDPVDRVINLIPNEYQISNVEENVMLVLPEVDKFTEIYLYITPTTELNIIIPAGVKCANSPAIEVGKTYEYIFTYIGVWLAGVVVYE